MADGFNSSLSASPDKNRKEEKMEIFARHAKNVEHEWLPLCLCMAKAIFE